MSTKKPIVPTGILTEFGEVLEMPDTLFDETGMNGDLTYVPGFSDMRRDADLARAEKRTPTPLPVNLRWARRTQVNGTPTAIKQVQHGNNGYRPVRWDEIGKNDWLKAAPPGAQKLADGTIGNGDSVLMIVDGKRAAQNAAKRTVKWLEQNVTSREAAIKAAGVQVKGSTPSVTVESK